MTLVERTRANYLNVTPSYSPPETYQGDVSKRVNPHLDDYSHVILVDSDIEVPKEFFDLPQEYPDADIIAPKVIPASRVFRLWEAFTYGIRLNRMRVRGSPIIYSTNFLKSVGGYPNVESPDTWLLRRAGKVVQVPLKAIHHEDFNLRYSIQKQVYRGKARAEMRQPVWRVAAHSIFRCRPVVLFAYLYYRNKKVAASTHN